MRIRIVGITDSKPFLGKHSIAVTAKHVFVYGENGGGKTALFYLPFSELPTY